jgi:hypothetical protein
MRNLLICSILFLFVHVNAGFAMGDSIRFRKVSTLIISLDSLRGIDYSNIYYVRRNGEPCLVTFSAAQGRLRFIGLKGGKEVSSIDFSKVSSQFSVDGFKYVNDDTIFLYSYSSSSVRLVNARGQWQWTYVVGKEALIDTTKKLFCFYAWPRVSSVRPIVKYEQSICLVGSTSGESVYDMSDNRTVMAWMDIIDHRVVQKVPYLRSYSSANYGGMEFRDVYVTGHGGKLYLSFPISDTIVAFDLETSKTTFIVPSPRQVLHTKSINADKSLCVSPGVSRDLYTSSDAYEAIYFDQYRNVFYRVFKHRVTDKSVRSVSGVDIAAYSIHVYDMEFNLLISSERLYGYMPSISFVDEKGLHILKVSAGKPMMVFDCFSFKVRG